MRARLLAVDYASHSAQVEQVEAELAEALAGISPGPGTVPFWSGLTGQPMDGTGLDARYWYDSLRGQVRFDQVISGLAEAGYGTFIEASPHPVLIVPVQEILDQAGTGVACGTLRRDAGGPAPAAGRRRGRFRRRDTGELAGAMAGGPAGGTARIRVPAAAVLASPRRRGG